MIFSLFVDKELENVTTAVASFYYYVSQLG